MRGSRKGRASDMPVSAEWGPLLAAASRLFPSTPRAALTPAQLLQTLWALEPGTVEAGVVALGRDVGAVLAGLELGPRHQPGAGAAPPPTLSEAAQAGVATAQAIDDSGLAPAVRLLGALVTLGHVDPGGGSPDQATRNDFWRTVRRIAPGEGGAAEDQGLVAAAAGGSLSPVVPRDEVAGRVVEILCRLHGRSIALVGPEGVGKSSVVADLVWRIARGAVPLVLRRMRPVGLEDGRARDGAPLIDRLAAWLDGPATGVRVPVVEGATFRLLLDEDATALGRLLVAYGAAGRPLLLVTDRALFERFGKLWPEVVAGIARVEVAEPPLAFTGRVVRWQGARRETEGGVRVGGEACDAAVAVGQRVLRHRFFPAKAVDLLDDAVGRAVAVGEGEVSAEAVREAAAARSGIPLGLLVPEGPLLPTLEEDLRRRVVGQDEAIATIAERLRLVKGNYDQEPHRPDGVFLFTGPTGVGKTEMAEALARALFGERWRNHFIRKHMSEFSEAVSVTKLISSAPGYEGHATTRTLVDEVRERPASVLLLDEMEKAHPQVHTLFLQLFEEGVLTDARGRTAHFGEVTVVMTANVFEDLEGRVGFENERRASREAFDEEAALLKVFPRELVNRFSDTIRFRCLDEGDLRKIVEDHLVPRLQSRLENEGVTLSVDKRVCGWLAEKGASVRYGARHLGRTFDAEITTPVVAQLYGERARGNGRVQVSLVDGGALKFSWQTGRRRRSRGGR